jgi:hypothetical protein
LLAGLGLVMAVIFGLNAGLGGLLMPLAPEFSPTGYSPSGGQGNSPVSLLILPALLFAMGHSLPAEAGDNALLIALWAGLFAVLMADLTARAGTLGPAYVQQWHLVAGPCACGWPDRSGALHRTLHNVGHRPAAAVVAGESGDFANPLTCRTSCDQALIAIAPPEAYLSADRRQQRQRNELDHQLRPAPDQFDLLAP